jgi:hypothetical protein
MPNNERGLATVGLANQLQRAEVAVANPQASSGMNRDEQHDSVFGVMPVQCCANGNSKTFRNARSNLSTHPCK